MYPTILDCRIVNPEDEVDTDWQHREALLAIKRQPFSDELYEQLLTRVRYPAISPDLISLLLDIAREAHAEDKRRGLPLSRQINLQQYLFNEYVYANYPMPQPITMESALRDDYLDKLLRIARFYSPQRVNAWVGIDRNKRVSIRVGEDPSPLVLEYGFCRLADERDLLDLKDMNHRAIVDGRKLTGNGPRWYASLGDLGSLGHRLREQRRSAGREGGSQDKDDASHRRYFALKILEGIKTELSDRDKARLVAQSPKWAESGLEPLGAESIRKIIREKKKKMGKEANIPQST